MEHEFMELEFQNAIIESKNDTIGLLKTPSAQNSSMSMN